MAGAPGAGGAAPDASGDGADPADVATDVIGPPADADPIKDAAIDQAGDAVVDATPDLRPRDMGSDLARNLPNGGQCVQSNQCASGFCVGGLCCNTSCTNPCQACAMVKTGVADGKCATAPQMTGMKCGRGCQQFPGQALLATVDKVCTDAGQCGFPQLPVSIEYCADTDPCTDSTCDQPNAYTARCVKVPKCGGNSCCCVTDNNGRACMTKASCTGPGKMCM